ncbi:hypothetical protein [Streptomyces sp. NPDC017964]|uniref:hypothetical protein n=1 Tax=Streptomyces sp. NPDC017964 TaxID=3365022 RepID=UPI00378DAAF4
MKVGQEAGVQWESVQILVGTALSGSEVDVVRENAYLVVQELKDLFAKRLDKLTRIGHRWTNHEEHGPVLRLFEEFGGLTAIFDDAVKQGIVSWMVLCYIGEPGGYGAGINGRSAGSR